MKIPEHLVRPGMSEAAKKQVEAFVQSFREKLSSSPTFDTTEAAVEFAVKMAKKAEFSFPSVWKEPEDVGKKYAVIHTADRGEAYDAGYTEVVDEKKVFDKANGITRKSIDEIEEV